MSWPSADTTEKDQESVWSVKKDVIPRCRATSDLVVNFTLQYVSFSQRDKLFPICSVPSV